MKPHETPSYPRHPNFEPVPEPSGLPSLRAFLIGVVLGILVVVAVVALTSQPPFHRQIASGQLQLPPGVEILDENGHNINAPQQLTLPPIEVTLPEVLSILADYDVVHESKLMTFLKYFGLTDPNTRTIYINSSVASDLQLETVIHEIIHVIYSRKGYDTRGPYDNLVEEKAQEVYAQLYGPPTAGGTK